MLYADDVYNMVLRYNYTGPQKMGGSEHYVFFWQLIGHFSNMAYLISHRLGLLLWLEQPGMVTLILLWSWWRQEPSWTYRLRSETTLATRTPLRKMSSPDKHAHLLSQKYIDFLWCMDLLWCVVILACVVNPRRACAARVTVELGLSVCLSVCLLLSISLLGCLFVPETIPSTQQATKVRKYVGFSLKMLRCRARALPPLYG